MPSSSAIALRADVEDHVVRASREPQHGVVLRRRHHEAVRCRPGPSLNPSTLGRRVVGRHLSPELGPEPRDEVDAAHRRPRLAERRDGRHEVSGRPAQPTRRTRGRRARPSRARRCRPGGFSSAQPIRIREDPAMASPSNAASSRAAGAGLVLLTLAAGQFLMTLDSSVMNVSIATVAEGRRHDGDRDPGRDHGLHARDGGADDHRRARSARSSAASARSRSAASSTAAARSRPSLAPSLPVLLFGWSFLEGVGAALILPAIVALVAGNFAQRAPAGRLRPGRRRRRDRGRRRPADRRLLHDVLLVALGVRRRGRDRRSSILVLARKIADAPSETRPQLDVVGAVLSALGLGAARLRRAPLERVGLDPAEAGRSRRGSASRRRSG